MSRSAASNVVRSPPSVSEEARTARPAHSSTRLPAPVARFSPERPNHVSRDPAAVDGAGERGRRGRRFLLNIDRRGVHNSLRTLDYGLLPHLSARPRAARTGAPAGHHSRRRQRRRGVTGLSRAGAVRAYRRRAVEWREHAAGRDVGGQRAHPGDLGRRRAGRHRRQHPRFAECGSPRAPPPAGGDGALLRARAEPSALVPQPSRIPAGC